MIHLTEHYHIIYPIFLLDTGSCTVYVHIWLLVDADELDYGVWMLF